MTQQLFSNVLFNLHVLVVFLKLISNFILLWSEKMFEMISTFLNLLRSVLWPNMGSMLENVLGVLDKNVYPAAFGHMVCIY